MKDIKELLKEISIEFKKTPGLENRALVYKFKNDYKIIYPQSENTSTSTRSDIRFSFMDDNKNIYKLIIDTHSHHKLGAFFSSQDDMDDTQIAKINNEIIFGVFSWKNNKDTWLIRKFKSSDFTPLFITKFII